MQQQIDYVIHPGGNITGKIYVPGDKSISHRSIMLASIAHGTSEINNFLMGEDSLATLQAFKDMGVNIIGPTKGKVIVHGKGLTGLKPADKNINLGNSGTSMRLISGILAGQIFTSTLCGDESLSQRPMARIIKPLSLMGANIQASKDKFAPLVITGQPRLEAIEYVVPMASAQVKSSILLAGLYAASPTSVIEKTVTRNHTELMLAAFGVRIVKENTRTSVYPSQLQATSINIPNDISSAAFFMVAALISQGSNIILPDVGINETRDAICNILLQMGANIKLNNIRFFGKEKVADIHVQYSALQGIDVPEDLLAIAIDEFPILCIAAACAQGQTIFRGAAELRVKESDRIQAMSNGLTSLGIQNIEKPDGLIVDGGEFVGGTIDSHGDHRIAMSFAVAGLVAKENIGEKL